MTPSWTLVFAVWMAALGGCQSKDEWFIEGWDGQVLTVQHEGHTYKAICTGGSILAPGTKEGVEVFRDCPHIDGFVTTSLPSIPQFDPETITDGLVTVTKSGTELRVNQWITPTTIRWQETYQITLDTMEVQR